MSEKNEMPGAAGMLAAMRAAEEQQHQALENIRGAVRRLSDYEEFISFNKKFPETPTTPTGALSFLSEAFMLVARRVEQLENAVADVRRDKSAVISRSCIRTGRDY